MADNRKAGIALIAGSLGGVVTMAIHPVGGAGMNPGQVENLIRLSGVAHGLALLSMLLLVLGACGLTRTLAGPDRMAIVALVTFGFAAVAVMIAGVVSGWIVPDTFRLMQRDNPVNAGTWKIVIASIFQINQAMSRVYAIGAAGAITLWSACCLRLRRLSRALAIYGCLTAPLVAMLIVAGHLRLNVHGMAVVMLSEVIWFVGMGYRLLRTEELVGLWRSEDTEPGGKRPVEVPYGRRLAQSQIRGQRAPRATVDVRRTRRGPLR